MILQICSSLCSNSGTEHVAEGVTKSIVCRHAQVWFRIEELVYEVFRFLRRDRVAHLFQTMINILPEQIVLPRVDERKICALRLNYYHRRKSRKKNE